MSAAFPGAGLRTEQAPPLSIPMAFFWLAPLALVAAGGWLAAEPVASRWTPAAVAVTHLGTLGLLGSVMLGALYQMVPVVAGAPVPIIRLAHVVHAAWAAGVLALLAGLATPWSWLLHAGAGLLGLALLAFLGPVGVALARAPTRSETVWGMRLAVAGLAGVAGVGVLLALGRSGAAVPGVWSLLVGGHVGLGLVVWVGGLMAAVSWQVVPMFYLTPAIPVRARRATLAGVATTLLGVPIVWAVGAPDVWLHAVVGVGAVAIWVLHPATVVLALRARRRKRMDGSQGFWWVAMAVAPLVLAAGVATVAAADARWPVLFGWLAIWGWAGLVVHGTLSRIVPFLVWFHRYADLVGRADVPPMRRLLPDPWVRRALVVHGVTIVVGAVGVAVAVPVIVRVAGLGLVATGVALAAALWRVGTHRSAAA